ncbi:MAG: AbrB/MazE/SpoVT family DNA-binding domain-containing protein [Flavobacteriales bacterium]|jgi:antitoxin MazE
MKIKVISIGNSKGIRLPNKVLKMYNISEEVSLVLEKEQIVLKPVNEARAGWAEAFAAGDSTEERLLPDFFNDEHSAPWQD